MTTRKLSPRTIKPIRTRRDHAAALARIEAIWGAKEGTLEADEADVLATLVAAYEEEHFPIEDPDPIAAILFRLDQLGVGHEALTPLVGSRHRVWEVLHGKRRLTLAMIRKLHDELGIPADALIR